MTNLTVHSGFNEKRLWQIMKFYARRYAPSLWHWYRRSYPRSQHCLRWHFLIRRIIIWLTSTSRSVCIISPTSLILRQYWKFRLTKTCEIHHYRDVEQRGGGRCARAFSCKDKFYSRILALHRERTENRRSPSRLYFRDAEYSSASPNAILNTISRWYSATRNIVQP